MLQEYTLIQGVLSHAVSGKPHPATQFAGSRDSALLSEHHCSRITGIDRGNHHAQQTFSTRLHSRECPDAACMLETFSGCFDSALQILLSWVSVVALRST